MSQTREELQSSEDDWVHPSFSGSYIARENTTSNWIAYAYNRTQHINTGATCTHPFIPKITIRDTNGMHFDRGADNDEVTNELRNVL